MTRHLPVCLVILFLFSFPALKSQCPPLFDYTGTPTSSPLYLNCSGAVYNLSVSSPSAFGSYTISWGDGSPNATGASYTASTSITHSYAATTATYVLTLLTSTCTVTGTVVQEQAAQAAITVPPGVTATLCAPGTLTLTNGTTFTSATTSYTWNFGDSPGLPEVHSYTNAGQNVTHLYPKGSVNCVTQVSLMAKNYCNAQPSIAGFGPLQVFEKDDAVITADKIIRCWPDAQFTFSNNTIPNCFMQGNTSQRFEKWNFGNYWGMGHDSIIGWNAWPPATPVSVSYTSTGQYTVSLQDSSLCGTDTEVITVFIVNSPSAGVIAPGTVICQNAPATFTNSSSPGFSYRWNQGTGGGFVNLGSGNKTFTYTSPGTYTLQVIALIPGAGGSCADTASVVISVQPIPTASFSASSVAGCNSLSVTYTDQSSSATGWNWDFGNGVTSTLQAPAAQDYTATGEFTPTLVVTSASGCAHSSTLTITIRPKPVPAFAQFTVCAGSPVTFTNNSTVTGTNAITGYTWNPGDGSAITTASAPAHTYTAPGTYTVKLAATTAFCSDSTALPVTVNVTPTASFVISPNSGCPPFAANFGNLSQNATVFLWRFGVSPTSTSSSTGASYTYTNASQGFINHTVTLVASTAAGCTDSTQGTLSVKPKPVAAFSVPPSPGCSPLAVTFTNNSIGATSSAWAFGDGNFSGAQHPVHTYTNTSPSTQTMVAQLVVTNSVNCTDTMQQSITVFAEPPTNFSIVPQSGCSPLVVNFPALGGVTSYTWNYGDGSSPTTTTSAHSYTYVNSTLSDQVFTVTMDAETGNGCSGTGTSTVTVFHSPVASFSASASSGCSPLTVSLTNSSTGSVSGHSWTFGNGLTSTVMSPAATFTNAPGSASFTNTVKLVVQTANNCRDSTTSAVIVLARPLAAFVPDTPACTPKNMKFKNTSQGAASFKWTFGDGGSSTQDTAQHLFVNNDPVAKTFQTRLVATSSAGCRDSVTVPVIIRAKPEFVVTALPESGCSPLRVRFPAIAGVTEYEWSHNNVIFGSAPNATTTFENLLNAPRTFTVRLVGRDAFKCTDTATKVITVYPRPVSKFTAAPMNVFLPAATVTFSNESSAGASTFTWSFGDGNSSTVKHPTHTYQNPGEFEVMLIAASSTGCRDTFALPEKVVAIEEAEIRVPNAFTPNTDGSPGTIFNPLDLSNDIFHPVIRGTETYLFSIYSRWGELLFETSNPGEGWDGYFRGLPCTPDVYIWKISATFTDGRTIKKTGDVLLLR